MDDVHNPDHPLLPLNGSNLSARNPFSVSSEDSEPSGSFGSSGFLPSRQQRKANADADDAEQEYAEVDHAEAGHAEAGHAEEEYAEADQAEAADATPERPDGRKYKTRTCRICFDEVQPSFEPPTATTQLFGQRPRVRYISEDPECGRLMRPCKCKGTQKYVHEGCLRAWRMAAGADRNLWKCPTCLYEYKLNRLSWGAWVSSTVVRAALTLLVLVLSVFLLGFVAEPILNFVDPGMFLASFNEFEDLEDWIPEDQPDTWSWHFTRGFFALGVMGVFKSFMALRPWHAWNIRIGGGGRRRRGGGFEDISWVMVLLGVAMFLRVSDIPWAGMKWNKS